MRSASVPSNARVAAVLTSVKADGYGRIKGVGAVIQTFGPGELSAYCGIAGAYTEYVPVVSLVGYPPITAMNNNLIMHHSLGDGKFGYG
jgi:pyruvate decarboxylase